MTRQVISHCDDDCHHHQHLCPCVLSGCLCLSLRLALCLSVASCVFQAAAAGRDHCTQQSVYTVTRLHDGHSCCDSYQGCDAEVSAKCVWSAFGCSEAWYLFSSYMSHFKLSGTSHRHCPKHILCARPTTLYGVCPVTNAMPALQAAQMSFT